MPITINDCRFCGAEPAIVPTTEGQSSLVYLICANLHETNATAEEYFGNRAIEQWNEANKEKGNANDTK